MGSWLNSYPVKLETSRDRAEFFASIQDAQPIIDFLTERQREAQAQVEAEAAGIEPGMWRGILADDWLEHSGVPKHKEHSHYNPQSRLLALIVSSGRHGYYSSISNVTPSEAKQIAERMRFPDCMSPAHCRDVVTQVLGESFETRYH
jgi:hypothetical protein